LLRNEVITAAGRCHSTLGRIRPCARSNDPIRMRPRNGRVCGNAARRVALPADRPWWGRLVARRVGPVGRKRDENFTVCLQFACSSIQLFHSKGGGLTASVSKEMAAVAGILVLVVGMTLGAQQGSTSSGSAEQQVTQLERDWCKAMIAGDATTIGRILADCLPPTLGED
jgi:hypothetical protein